MGQINNYSYKKVVLGKGIGVDFNYFTPYGNKTDFSPYIEINKLIICFDKDFNLKLKEFFSLIILDNIELLKQEIGREEKILSLVDIRVNFVDFQPSHLIDGLIDLVKNG